MIPDSHAHLDLLKDGIPLVLNRARDAGVGPVLAVGMNHESNTHAVRLAEEHQQVLAAVGMHPSGTTSWSEEDLLILKAAARSSDQIVALGETGLDYYRKRSPKAKQKEAFQAHLHLAKELGLPVIVHDREAHEDVMDILSMEARGAKVLLHCFSGGRDMLSECVSRGYFISFAGPVTFKKSHDLRELARAVPEELLMVETDAPFLTPVPYRGRPNQPAYVRYVAEKLAEVRECSLEELTQVLSSNFSKIFGRDLASEK